MRVERYDVYAIGSGSTSPSIVQRLAREGMRAGTAEREALGGECTNHGCVPSKALLKAARVASLARRAAAFGIEVPEVRVDLPAVMARVQGIVAGMLKDGTGPFDRAGVDVHFAEARAVGERRVELDDGTLLEADRIVLATGTHPTAPPIEGLEEAGYWTNRDAVDLEALPSSIAILGSGPIGLEFAQIFARFGSRVTLVELFDRILIAEDGDAAAALRPALEADDIRILTGAETTRVTREGGRVRLEIADGRTVEAEELLVATGRAPTLAEHDLEALGVEVDELGRPVLTETLRSANPDVWVAGDATGRHLFVHVNAHEANTVTRDILGRPRPVDYRIAPRVTFTEPEVASVGLTEEEARDLGREVQVGVASMADDERSVIEGETFGLVKIVADAETKEVLGGHIVAERAGELIHEIVAAMAGGAGPRDVGSAIHAYPTASQSVRAAFSRIR